MNIKHLKAKILDLAIRGKLVPQAPSEGNAADLLKKIREEKNFNTLDSWFALALDSDSLDEFLKQM